MTDGLTLYIPQNASFEDEETLVVLWRTVRLIQMIQDLVVYNKTLKADWHERQTTILSLLRDLVAAQPSESPMNWLAQFLC